MSLPSGFLARSETRPPLPFTARCMVTSLSLDRLDGFILAPLKLSKYAKVKCKSYVICNSGVN